MKRWILILMAFLTVLSSVGGEAVAAPKRKAPHGGTATTMPGNAADLRWELGPPSHTYYQSPITGAVSPLTAQRVGFSRRADGSLPRVGQTYYAGVIINSARSTAVALDLALPPNTVLDIDPANPAKRVVCSGLNTDTGEQWEWTDDDCDQSPTPGRYGFHFAPSSTENDGLWLLPAETLILQIPIRSQAELKGWLASPPHCLTLSVFAGGALGDGWDHPRPTDVCPLPDGHGASQGVVVTPGPVVQPPPPIVDHGTHPPPHKHKKKGKKGKGKKGKGKKR
jgi:hypothetical protein